MDDYREESQVVVCKLGLRESSKLDFVIDKAKKEIEETQGLIGAEVFV